MPFYIENSVQEEIKKICFQVAEKLKNTDSIAHIAAREENAFMNGILSPWDPVSLDYGYPALIVFFSEMDTQFPGQGWDEKYKNGIDQLLDVLKEREVNDFSLFSGFAGVCFAIQLVAQKDRAYANVEDTFCFTLMHHIEQSYLEPLERGEKFGKLPLPSEYDAINGLPCFVFYLLAYRSKSDVRTVIERILRQLVRVTWDIPLDGYQVPGWYVNVQDVNIQQAAPQFANAHLLKTYPNGYFETGLAHGIAGCLAALAKAFSCHMEVTGQRAAIDKIIYWLRHSQKEINTVGYVWPRRMGLNFHARGFLEVRADEYYFDGWAHGAPGILNTLLLAADALNDEELRSYCVKEFHKMIERVQHHKTSRGLPLCYGLAGVMTILYNAEFLTKENAFAETIREIATTIISQYQQEAPFGFKCLAPTNQIDENLLINNPGLLTGSIGVVLSLLLTISKPHPDWLSICLLK